MNCYYTDSWIFDNKYPEGGKYYKHIGGACEGIYGQYSYSWYISDDNGQIYCYKQGQGTSEFLEHKKEFNSMG